MQPSRIREKLNHKEEIYTAKSLYQHPDLVELVGSFGFDGLWICLEHARYDPSTVYSLIRACRMAGYDAIMRIKPANYADLLWFLEAGARGLMLPRVRNLDEVREVVKMMKFPPQGCRGLDGVGPEADFGRVPLTDYMTEANRENFLIAQIEDPEVLPHIDAIAAEPGTDILFVGPSDLSLALGKPRQFEDPEIEDIMKQVIAACEKNGKVAGLPCAPEKVGYYREMGFRYFNVGSDFGFVKKGLNDTREALMEAGVSLKDRFIE